MDDIIDPDSIDRADTACRDSECASMRHKTIQCRTCVKYSVNWGATKEAAFLEWEASNEL